MYLTLRTSYGRGARKPPSQKTQIEFVNYTEIKILKRFKLNFFTINSQKVTGPFSLLLFSLFRSHSYKTLVTKCQDYILSISVFFYTHWPHSYYTPKLLFVKCSVCWLYGKSKDLGMNSLIIYIVNAFVKLLQSKNKT